ncbi:MAG: PLP-dependent cysteine synthase family protein [Owenweeksia sp.]
MIGRESILETVGATPLVRLQKLSKELNTNIWAKLEAANPGHSSKDRIALYLVRCAEEKGLLKPGGTIIESTSGNTGRSLAMVASLKGYRCVIYTTTKISFEKKTVMEALGAEVIVCSTDVKAEDPQSYYSRAKALHEETPNSIYISQYHNEHNVEAHYHSTGPELWKQTEGGLTHFVCCVGTGGTISGTARYLKELNPGIKVLGVDAVGSVLTKFAREGIIDESEIKPYHLEGVGKDIIPGTVLFDFIDEFVQVEDKPSLLRARELARTESILAGPSGGAALEGLFQFRNHFKPDDQVVVILPDHGISYLSKLYNDEWMKENGFL